MDTPLTRVGACYARELSLARLSPTRRAAAWIESEGHRERLCWRFVEDDGLSSIAVAEPVSGAPSSPVVCARGLLWVEFRGTQGRLFEARLGSETLGPPRAIAPLEQLACDEFACAVDSNGTLWLLAQTWADEAVTLRLLTRTGEEWEDRGRVVGGSAFRARPRLCASGPHVMAAWDEWQGRRCRVAVAALAAGDMEPQTLDAPDGCWESLPSLACDGDGTWHVARCRERLVALRDGIAGHHSELVVSALAPGAREWRERACVDIDHAMNPWMAAYMGWRRYPRLVAGDKGAWLLWEEKQDPTSMDPPLGRLCAMPAVGGEAVVVVDGRSKFVVEAGGEPGSLLVASKTQFARHQQHLPYVLHRLDLGELVERRPADLESNAAASALVVRPIARERPRLEPEGLKLFFGDPHLHSRFSQDLDGEQDELYRFAREVAGLDFVAFTENDFHWFVEPLSPAAWARSRRNADHFDDPGRFTALVGWEYTKQQDPERGHEFISHRCVLFPGREAELHCWLGADAPTPKALAERFAGRRVLLHHHHPMGYDISDDSVERNIEVCSGWWNCMTNPKFVEKLHGLLRRGFRLGFFGASDNHERNPGLGGALTGAWATENTREAIFDAFWHRRVFATTGLRPDLRFRVCGAFMGGEAATDGAPLVEASVRCEAAVRRLEILRDGALVHVERGDTVEWEDAGCKPGDHFYYLHALFEGEESNPYWNIASAYGVHAWSSPVWVRRR